MELGCLGFCRERTGEMCQPTVPAPAPSMPSPERYEKQERAVVSAFVTFMPSSPSSSSTPPIVPLRSFLSPPCGAPSVNLKKCTCTESYVPILSNKTQPSWCHQCAVITSSRALLGQEIQHSYSRWCGGSKCLYSASSRPPHQKMQKPQGSLGGVIL